MRLPDPLVRHKLNMLVLIPLTAVLVLAVPEVERRADTVRDSDRTAASMREAAAVGQLVEQVQREQLVSLAHLVSPYAMPGPVLTQMGAVDRELSAVRAEGLASDTVGKAVELIDSLAALRTQVLNHSVSALEATSSYDTCVNALLDTLSLWTPPDSGADDARRQSGIDALLRGDAAGTSANAALLAALADQDPSAALALADEQRTRQTVWAARFGQAAESSDTRLAGIVVSGSVPTRAHWYAERIEAAARKPLSESDRLELLEGAANTFQLQTELRLLVEHTIATDTANTASDKARSEIVSAVVLSGLLLALLALVVTLSTLVGRSVARPLRLLTEAAARAADTAERELRRVGDDDDAEPVEAPAARLTMNRSDEIGVLATAVDRVQSGAYELVKRQQTAQRNVAAMFAGVGRRTHNLVSRQLTMIDDLERDETDQELLQSLYALDHLTNRLRRTAGNLVVLSGDREPFGPAQPLSAVHALRSALAEVEDFQRVQFQALLDVRLSPAVVSPLVSIIAELLENALSFSPPDTPVELSMARIAEGCLITVLDHGVGMSAERLDEENARIRSRERLDLMPTDTLGLFVVGRLSRRTGIEVRLDAYPDGGTAAWVTVPHSHLVRAERPHLDDGTATPRQDASGAPLPDTGAGTRQLPSAMRTPLPPPRPEPEPATAADEPSLTRRVPGTQLPAFTDVVPPTGPHPAPHEADRSAPGPDPAASRDAIERYEAGVAHAQAHAHTLAQDHTLSQDHTRAQDHTYPRAQPQAQAQAQAHAQGHLQGGTHMNATPLGAFQHFMDGLRDEIDHLRNYAPWPAFDAMPPPEAMAAHATAPGAGHVPLPVPSPVPTPRPMPASSPPPAGPAPEGLVRRVPGAGLSPDLAVRPVPVPLHMKNPDLARSLVLDFESGVARARAEADPIGCPAPGTPRRTHPQQPSWETP
ncbi:ATP-binding protein [Streptomyces sp. NBC_00102]|uniref:sensor histidine kinase n=1 Tax=Streptomyces sp. NBC_00102 TaxID=2975652 RepID=UPI0022545C4E|nr:ATP-binding protein [Streptomyces sp. NBC_00102]MCX5400462.1 nitrate- and nitrite sensing domain-containing protein [Streptomyces sp. NBC_00102]